MKESCYNRAIEYVGKKDGNVVDWNIDIPGLENK